MGKAQKKTGGYIADFFLFALIAFATIMILVVISTKYNVGPYRVYMVDGASMQPTLNLGDIVFFKSVSQEDVREGDIILFNRLGGLVTHRVTSIKDSCVTTKGDNTDPDPGCAYDISGKYLFKIPYAGYFGLGLQYIGNSFVTGLRVIIGKGGV